MGLKRWDWLNCCDKNEALIAPIVIGGAMDAKVPIVIGGAMDAKVTCDWDPKDCEWSGCETNQSHFSNTLSSVPCFVFLLLGHAISVASLVTDCW